MKKLLSVMLVLVMLLSTFSLTASAQEKGIFDTEDYYYDVLIDDVYYMLEEGVGAVTGFDFDKEDTSPKAGITIPEKVTYKGKEFSIVMVSDMAFAECDYTSISLPKTITYIGNYAFMSSPYLEKVVIPSSCQFEYFGADVFIGTPFEAEIYSKTETIFGQNVLYAYTGNANQYVIPDRIDTLVNNCFFMSGVKSVVINSKITEIPYCAFASCRNLKEVTIPDNIENIGIGAFKDCTSLEKVTLGKNVCSLGVDCFANTKLKSIHLGANVNTIYGAFNDCKYLETITVDPANETYVVKGNAVYSDISNYVDVDLPMTVYMLEYYILSKTPAELTLDSDVAAIGPYAFYNNKNIKKLSGKTIGLVEAYAFNGSTIEEFDANMLMYVGSNAFRNCKNLKSIDLHNVWEFSVSAFENCTSLENVTFSESVYNIGELAFANTGLKNVTIYGDDCYVNEAAFKGCKELESVRLEEGVTYVGMNAFLDCPKLKTIYLSKTVENFEENAFNGCDDVTFEVIKYTEAYDYVDDMGFDYEVVGSISLWERIVAFFRSIFWWL